MKEHLRSYMGYVTSKLSYQQWMKSDTSVSYPTTLLMNFHRIFMIARYWIRRNVEERVSNIKVAIDRLYSTENGWTLGLKGSWIRIVDWQSVRHPPTRWLNDPTEAADSPCMQACRYGETSSSRCTTPDKMTLRNRKKTE